MGYEYDNDKYYKAKAYWLDVFRARLKGLKPRDDSTEEIDAFENACEDFELGFDY